MSKWSKEDNASITRAGRELHARGWRKAFSLNEMLRSYEGLVRHVEQGHDDTVYDYGNDLACRDWLALAWLLFTENVRHSLEADLGALDDRFRAATVDDDGRSLGRFFTIESKPWWWRRIPVKVWGDFAADLAEED